MSRRDGAGAARYHHGNLRAALLAAARAMLEEAGPASLSLREIARRVGVAAPSIYHHFASLDAIAAALAEQGFSELVDRLDAAPTNTKGQLAPAGHAYIAFALANPGLYRLMFGEGLGPSFAEGDAVGILRQRAYDRVKAGLRQRLPEAEVATAALYLWSLVHGLALLMIDGRIDAGTDADDTIAAVLRLAGTGLPTAAP